MNAHSQIVGLMHDLAGHCDREAFDQLTLAARASYRSASLAWQAYQKHVEEHLCG